MWARLWSEARYRARAVFRREALERELDEELRFHLEQEAARHRAAGLPAAEAMRQARLAFGGLEVVKEQTRDGRGVRWLERAGQDLRYAVRALRRTPGFTVAVIATLGLGVGINAAMFGIVDRLLFRAPPLLRDPARVHRVYLQWHNRNGLATGAMMGYASYLDFRRATTQFDALAGYSVRSLPVGSGPASAELPVGVISATLFDFFDAAPVLGRFFTAAEDTVPLGAQVAVLSHGFWQARYGGRPDALGQVLRVGTAAYTIIGVAPRGFEGISDEGPPALFIPITAYAGVFRAGPNVANYYTRYNWSWMQLVVRRKPGVTRAAAEADLSRAQRRSYEAQRAISPGMTAPEIARPAALAGPVQAERGPNQSTVTRVATWVSGVALIVLLIACANVANLMLARAVRRRREIAVRLALGVSRGRLFGQLLTESLLLAGAGAVVGLLLARTGGALLRALFLPANVAAGTLADPRTAAFVLAVAALAGGLTGLAPLLQARRTDLVEALKSGARDGGYRRSRLRTGLLALQAALSVVLLVGAALFVQSLRNVRALRLGYDVDPVVYIYPEQRGAQLADAEAAALRLRLLESARAVPGVESAALGLTVPFWDTWNDNLFVAGIDSVERLGSFTIQAGSPEFFATLGTRILRGRGFTAEDRAGAPLVAVVSQAMAGTLWPGREALGECFRIGADTVPCTTVVGIAEDIHQNSVTTDRGLSYYLPIAQFHPEAAVIFARGRGQGREVREVLRQTLQPEMPGEGYVNVTPLRDIVDPELRSWQLGATMFVALGGLALVLAAVGLYGVMAYDVAQRAHELGVRMALGARAPDVVRMVVGDGMRIAVAGVAVGSLIALWSGRWLAPLLFEQSPADPVVFGVVAGVLLLVAALATAIPALRATRVSPTVALRTE
ncbi:MAG: ABC transporter permease [Gemmatimonadetes bacterium]|nr:ABC transporter permease [Gemmatimonadota bacterium]